MVVHVSTPGKGSPATSAESTSQSAREQAIEPIKGAFLASLNHEVRTPLSGIMGMLDLLSETPLDEDQRDYLNAARMCTESLAELLNATLEYSALEAGQFTLDESEFSLREALDAALAHQESKAQVKNLKLSLALEEGLPETMIGDAPRVRELLGYLIANAIKFTHNGGVEVRASLETAEQGERLVMAVRDTGIGIETDKLDRIFEGFRQGEDGLSRNYPGLGLGLALARKLTLRMSGEISVESAPGAGSTFTVRIPLRRPSASATAVSASAGTPLILAVEDNPVGLRVLRHMLERRRFRVVPATSGREAIEAARTNPVDLVLMDLQMPDINGLEAAAAIRQIAGHEQTPILALTANCSDQVRELCLHHGMQAFLSKPVDPNELWTAVARYLNVPR